MKRLVKTASAIGLTAIFILSIFSTSALACLFSNTIYECEYDLIAGENIDIGKIVIWDERDTDGKHDLYIKYIIEEPCWYLEEVNLGIAWHDGGDTYYWDDYNWGKMVTSKGSPKVGKLPYSKDDFDMDTTWEIGPIDISVITDGDNLGCGDLAIAAHAVVYKKCGDTITQMETAWGDGEPFGKSWGMFMRFPCCKPQSTTKLQISIRRLSGQTVQVIGSSR